MPTRLRRIPHEAVLFALVAGGYAAHLFLAGYGRFYFDSGEYWQAGKRFGRDGHFSLLAYDYEWRGYSFPLLCHVLDVVGSALGMSAVTTVKIFGALLAATLGVIVLPRLARALFPGADIGLGRVLALNALLFVYWRDHFGFPLVDFPALLVVSVGVLALLRASRSGYAIAGLCLGLAANIRGNYAFALLAGVGVAALVPLRPWSWRARGTATALVLAGALVASFPQMLINNHQGAGWSPGIPIASEQGLIATWLGMRAQKYETYVGPVTGYPQPSVFYVDPAARRLLEEEGIQPVTRLGRPSFPSTQRYFKLVVEHPLQMSWSYVRHVFNGLDVKYPTPYIRDLGDTWRLLSLIQYTLMFVALARLLVPSARRALGAVRWSGIVVLLGALVGVIYTQAEPRYYLPLHALALLLVCFGPATRATLLGGSTGRRVALASSYAGFLLACLALSSATRKQLEFPQPAAALASQAGPHSPVTAPR